MSKIQEILDAKKFVFSIINGKDKEGEDVYAYVVYHKIDEEKVRKLMLDKTKSITEYSDDLLILISGKGKELSQRHQDIIKELINNYK